MDLSTSQTDALLEMGESASGHDFMKPSVLNELLKLELVYWRNPGELDFTPGGEEVYDELTRAGSGASRS